VLAVLDSQRESGPTSAVRQAVAGEWDLAVGTAIVGSRTLVLDVESN
jgi:hypothetical protein